MTEENHPMAERTRKGKLEITLQSLPLAIFVLNILLIYAVFFPNLGEIDLFDEASYINSGRLLYAGSFPAYAGNPLVAFLYLLAYVPVQSSPYWLIYSCTIGRFVLFGLLWLSSYLIGKRLSHLSSPLIMTAVLLISPALPRLLENPSNALFAAMSAFAFWQVLTGWYTKSTKHLWVASVFAGLAALSRNDGLVLFLVFGFLCVLLGMAMRRIGICLAAGIIPFAVLVGGYMALYGLSAGNWELGISERSYIAFEQGQGVAYSELYTTGNPYTEGQVEARRLFGTPEENQHSIINAIRRNPHAFLLRVLQIAKGIPHQAASAYGSGLWIVMFCFAARGALEIIARRRYLLLSIMLLWPAHLLVYFATFLKPGYLLLPYFALFSFVSMGLMSLVTNLGDRKERYLWTVALLAFAALGMIARKPMPFASSLVFLLGLWLTWSITSQYRDVGVVRAIGLVLVVCVVLTLRGDFPAPRFRSLGIIPDEQAALFMRKQLAPGARVASYAPGNVVIAKMTYVPISFELRHMTSEQDLSAWISEQDLKAIYVDRALKSYEPGLWALIEKQIGENLAVAFSSGDVQILLVSSPVMQDVR